ncbi:hypothetical protein EQG68_13770 [Flavobacterium piscinae]|uniref:Uncharacterized protein n=1 Tax=Flavobacterium piscinae TaxID=2506424 RepID=A0A4V1N3J6_9FLAO|nr:hypothetical protein [Flavobacterium piscinae]RXR28896.1 hypothetical protein EQG68_13770 [Flavobacterium piscinae]
MEVLSIKTWILLKKICCLSTIFFLFIVMNSCNFHGKSEIDLIFEQTKKIEILAYLDRNQWEVEDNPDYFDLKYIENNNIKIKEKYLKNRIILNSLQIDNLKKGLYENCKSFSIFEIAKCYNPRHSIIFYNEKNEIFGYIEICFECNRTKSSTNLNFISECALSQEELFKKFGITYFNE